jgi:hypothetical protein
MKARILLGIAAAMLMATAGMVVADVYLLDSDGDGVSDISDKCPGTESDAPEVLLGTNRWIWNGTDWVTRLPGGNGPGLEAGMGDMQGCSCEQVLGLYREKYGYEMEGHWKFGCSISVMEGFMEKPPVLVDAFCVDSAEPEGVLSSIVLVDGVNYRFKVRKVWTEAGIEGRYVDAEYTTSDYWNAFADGAEDQKDFQVNYKFVDWGAYTADHIYYHDFTGTGNRVNFRVFEGDAHQSPPVQDASLYENNRGTLSVEIYTLP